MKIKLLCILFLLHAMNNTVLAAYLTVGDEVARIESTSYIDSVKVTNINLNGFASPGTYILSTGFTFSGSTLTYRFEPNAYRQQGSYKQGVRVAAWGARNHIPSPGGPFFAPVPSASTWIISYTGALISSSNGSPPLPYECYGNWTGVNCGNASPPETRWKAIGIQNQWSVNFSTTPALNSSATYQTESMKAGPVYKEVQNSITFTRTRTYKTIALSADDTVNIGDIPQVGPGNTVSKEKSFSLATQVDGSPLTIPSGNANVSYTALSSPSCAGADLSLRLSDGTPWLTGSAGKIDANHLANDVTAKWTAPGTCSGTDSAKLRFTIAWN